MAEDDEPEPVRQGREALTHPLATYAAWELVWQCGGRCAYQRRPVAELVARVEPGTLTGDAARRLRCRCGAGPEIVGLSLASALGHPPRWLLLMGAGRRWRGEAGGGW